MWKKLYTIYDTVLEEHSAPFMANNDNHARMIFDKACSDAERSGYKSEYKLVYLTDFNISSGDIGSNGLFHKYVPEIPKDPQKDLFEEES